MPIWVGVAKTMIRAGVAGMLPSIRRLMGDGVHYLRYYNSRILASPNEELRETQRLIDQAGEGCIDLSLGAPPFDPELIACRPPNEQLRSGYPPVAGIPELRRAIARRIDHDCHRHVSYEDEVLVTAGVSQAIGLALDAFVDPYDRVVVMDPSYFMYRLAAMNRGAWVVQLPTWMENGTTRFDEGKLKAALRRAKMIFVNSPTNPTGGVLDQESLERIAWWCHKYDVLIFSDEVYDWFHYEDRHVSIATLPKAANRTIVANSFSKSHGMAAFRVGYCTASRHLIRPMVVSALATAPFVSIASQEMAIRALDHSARRRSSLRARFAARRDSVSIRLRAAGLDHATPGGAFFFWVPVRQFGITGSAFAKRLLEEERVLVMPGDSCGTSGRDHVRVSYAADGPSLCEGLDRLIRFASRLDRPTLSIAAPASTPNLNRHAA